jgi:hypothetical protein
MEKDNQVIAEFMGYFNWEDKAYGKYHESWDWLMPVVERILKTYSPESGVWPYEYNQLAKRKFGTSINEIYYCVVAFIKWYNQKPKEQSN